MKDTVNILGTEYKVFFREEKDEPKLKKADGYIDHSIKEIVVGIFEKDDMSIKDLKSYSKKFFGMRLFTDFCMKAVCGITAEMLKDGDSQKKLRIGLQFSFRRC